MAALTVQRVVHGGLLPSYATPGDSGDTFKIDNRTFLVVKNASVASINVTKKAYASARPGLAVTDEIVAVAAGAEKWISFDPAGFKNPVDGTAKATCSATASVTVAAVKI